MRLPQSGQVIDWPICFSVAYIIVSQYRHFTAMYFGCAASMALGSGCTSASHNSYCSPSSASGIFFGLGLGGRGHLVAGIAIGAFQYLADLIGLPVIPCLANAANDRNVLRRALALLLVENGAAGGLRFGGIIGRTWK